MASKNNIMSTAVANIQAFEDSADRFCGYQEQMDQAYFNIIESIKSLVQYGIGKECNTIEECVAAFKEKFPDSAGTYAISLLESASKKYDEFSAARNGGKNAFQHATIKGLVNAARIYKEIEKDMFYDRGVKFEYATDEAFVAVSKMDLY